MANYRRKLRREEQTKILRDVYVKEMPVRQEENFKAEKQEAFQKSSAPVKKVRAEKEIRAEEKAVVQEIPVTRQERDLSGLGEYERAVISVMTDAMSVEEIASALTEKIGDGFDTGGLLGALTMLELEAYIESLPGGIYRLIG